MSKSPDPKNFFRAARGAGPSGPDGPDGPSWNPLSAREFGAELVRSHPHYVVERLLGRGGMGAVYLASDKRSTVRVAIKLLRPDALDDETYLRRFSREIEILRKLEHSNVVRILDAGETVDGYRFLVMELLEGQTLASELDEHRMFVERALQIMTDICAGAQHVHERGVVHRDLKAANVFVRKPDEGAVILDFGVARDFTVAPSTFSKDAVPGTQGHIAPELREGKAATPASDVFSLGVIFLHMLAGKIPDGAYVMPSKYGLDRRLDAVVTKALSLNPNERYASAKDFADAIKAATEPAGPSAKFLKPVALTSPLLKNWRQVGMLALAFAATAQPMVYLPFMFSPCFFGLLLGYAVSGRLWPALLSGLLAYPDYRGALYIAMNGDFLKFVQNIFGWEAEIDALRLAVTLAGVVGAFGICASFVVWRPKQLWKLLPFSIVSGAIGSIGFVIAPGLHQSWPFAVWQILVGCSLFVAAGRLAPQTVPILNARYVASIAFVAVLISSFGLWRTASEMVWGKPVFTLSHILFEGQPGSLRRVGMTFGLVADWSHSNDNVRLWDSNTGKLVQQFSAGGSRGIKNLEFSPDRQMVATGDWSRIGRLLDVKSGTLRHVFGAEGRHDGMGTAVAFSRDGKTLFTDAGGRLRAWAVDTGSLLQEFPLENVWVESFSMSPDGTLLAATFLSEPPRLFSLKALTEIPTNVVKNATTAAFSPDGRRIAFSHNSGPAYNVSIWKVQGRTLEAEEELLLDGKGFIGGMQWSPNGKWLAMSQAGSETRTILWDARSGAKKLELPCEADSKVLQFSPDGEFLVCRGIGPALMIWSVETGKLVQSIKGFPHGVAFSWDGKEMAIITEDSLTLWRRK